MNKFLFLHFLFLGFINCEAKLSKRCLGARVGSAAVWGVGTGGFIWDVLKIPTPSTNDEVLRYTCFAATQSIGIIELVSPWFYKQKTIEDMQKEIKGIEEKSRKAKEVAYVARQRIESARNSLLISYYSSPKRILERVSNYVQQVENGVKELNKEADRGYNEAKKWEQNTKQLEKNMKNLEVKTKNQLCLLSIIGSLVKVGCATVHFVRGRRSVPDHVLNATITHNVLKRRDDTSNNCWPELKSYAVRLHKGLSPLYPAMNGFRNALPILDKFNSVLSKVKKLVLDFKKITDAFKPISKALDVFDKGMKKVLHHKFCLPQKCIPRKCLRRKCWKKCVWGKCIKLCNPRICTPRTCTPGACFSLQSLLTKSKKYIKFFTASINKLIDPIVNPLVNRLKNLVKVPNVNIKFPALPAIPRISGPVSFPIPTFDFQICNSSNLLP